MGKLTAEQIKECETKFGSQPGIRSRYTEFEYSVMDQSQKDVFWKAVAKPHLLEKKIPLPLCLAVEEPLNTAAPKDIREDLGAVRKRWGGVRVYAVTDRGETGPGDVNGLRQETGSMMYLPTSSSWHLVPYTGKNSVGRINLAPSAKSPRHLKPGIHTGPFGGCSGVAVLYGNREAGRKNPFAVAALAHLAGSDPASINWRDLYPSPRWRPDRRNEAARICAVAFADDEDAAGKIIEALNRNLMIRGSEITVYLARALLYCGVDHMGRFGHTRK